MRRPYLTLPIVSLMAIAALAGCRTEPAVAAYVEDVTISTEQLAAAVEQRLADRNIAAVVEPGDPDYQRLVLDQLVQQAIYRMLSSNYGVDVSDREVDNKIDELLSGGSAEGGDDAANVEETYAQIAAEQKFAEIDVREEVRRILIRAEIAAQEGLDAPIQEPALRERYEEIRSQVTTIQLGYITVPDQATADGTLAAVVANPASYPAVAATFPGPYTIPAVSSSQLADVPAPLVPAILQTAVGQGFTLAVPETGGIVVGFVAAIDVTPFEEVKDQLESESSGAVEEAVNGVVAEYVAGLDIDINPRYGRLNLGRVVPENGGGVVRILEDAGTP